MTTQPTPTPDTAAPARSTMVHVQLPSNWRATVFRCIEQYEDARAIAEWLDACGADLPAEDGAAGSGAAALTDDIDPLAGVWADPMGQWTADQADAARATLAAARKRLASLRRPSVSALTDDMVERAAQEMAHQGIIPWDKAPEGLRDSIRDMARRVLAFALGGRVVVDLPEPDIRDARAWVEHWNRHPDTLLQEERFALQRLADIREARRLAAAQRAER